MDLKVLCLLNVVINLTYEEKDTEKKAQLRCPSGNWISNDASLFLGKHYIVRNLFKTLKY